MVNDELNKGDDYRNIEPTYQIIFITDESKEEQLVDIYMSRNEKGRAEKYNLIHRAYVYIDYIEEILKEKKVEELTEFEKLVYIFKKGLDDGIIDVESKVKRYMGEKYKEFKNTDEGMRHLTFQREMWQWQTKQEQLLAKREKEERERQDREREEKDKERERMDKERERMDKERELQDQERARIDLELQERERQIDEKENQLEIRENILAKKIAKSKAQGVDEGKMSSLRSLMDSMNWTIEQAMAALQIPSEQYDYYKELMKTTYNTKN